MSRTKKIVSLAIAMALVLAVMAVGIYAAQSASVSANGTATFTGEDVLATIIMSSTPGSYANGADADGTSIKIDANGNVEWNGDKKFNLGTLKMVYNVKEYSYIFTVTNDHGSNAMQMTIDDSALSGINIEGKISADVVCTEADGVTGSGDTWKIESGKTATLTLTINLESVESDIAVDSFGFAISLTQAE